MNDYLDFKEMQLKLQDIQKTTYKCKCGHSVVIVNKNGRAICSYCKNYVFKDKETEFKYRTKENQLRERRKSNEKYNQKK